MAGTISLSDALAQAPTTRALRVDTILTHELDKPDAVTLRQALSDPLMPAGRIERALGQLGVTCSGTAISKWRAANGVMKASNAR